MYNKSRWTSTYKVLLAATSFFIVSNIVTAQKAVMDKAWSMFYQNKISESRKLFIEAENDETTKSDANLALSILANIDQENKDAFKYFSAFVANSPNATPAMFALWSSESLFSGSAKKTKEQLALLEQISKNKAIDGTMRAMAYSMLGSNYEIADDMKASINAYNQIGSIEGWQIAGVFENISASGFNKDYEPISHPENDKKFINKYGASIKWFDVPPNRNDKWIDFSYIFFEYPFSIITL
jgi:hypothetical protein